MYSYEDGAGRDSHARAAAALTTRWMLPVVTAGALLLACAGVALAQPGSSPPRGAESAGTDRYIVVLEDDVDQPSEVASGIEQRQDVDVNFVYSDSVEGFSATIPDEDLAAVRANPRVDYVEPDGRMKATYQERPWGVDRVGAGISSTLAGNGSGAIGGVNAYVVDTGIDRAHPDLNVVRHVNFTRGKNVDCDGHGTHVAGTMAAKDDAEGVVGVAPGAPLTGVKVLGCNGSGWTSNIIKGIDWVTKNAKKPAVANLSLGGRTSKALDDAVRRSARAGIFYSVAAGNAGVDACTESPARAGGGLDNGIVTVAASGLGDQEAYFSNYGRCVDVWAPGENIASTQLGGGTTTMSGTSMASPHVAGGAALYLSTNSGSRPTAVEGQLKADTVATGTRSKDGGAIERLFVGRY